MRPKQRPSGSPGSRERQSSRATLPPLILGHLAIDQRRQQVRVGGQAVHLTPREFNLLWMLAQEPDKVYRRDELLALVWGTETFVTARTVDVHMAKLRKKLRIGNIKSEIAETIWGVGYRLRI